MLNVTCSYLKWSIFRTSLKTFQLSPEDTPEIATMSPKHINTSLLVANNSLYLSLFYTCAVQTSTQNLLISNSFKIWQVQLVAKKQYMYYVHFIGSTASTGSSGGGGKAATLTARAFSASSAACLFNKIYTQNLPNDTNWFNHKQNKTTTRRFRQMSAIVFKIWIKTEIYWAKDNGTTNTGNIIYSCTCLSCCFSQY